MSPRPRYSAPLILVPLIGAAMSFAPAAAAEPAPTVPGAGPADQIIGELQALGYEVAVNWTNGQDSSPPLSRCRVTAFHNPDRSGGVVQPGSTVHVDVLCPDASGD
jgi:hypothetical protein